MDSYDKRVVLANGSEFWARRDGRHIEITLKVFETGTRIVATVLDAANIVRELGDLVERMDVDTDTQGEG